MNAAKLIPAKFQPAKLQLAQLQPAISARALSVFRGHRSVVKDVSFELNLGQILGVIGANGAGKTSLLGAISGENSDIRGELFMNGHSIARMRPSDLSRARAVLPQQANLTFDLNVCDVIQMGAYPFPEALPVQVLDWVNEAIQDADLSSFSNSRYENLSGGEQQRVQFARVLVQARAIAHFNGHAWIMLDEPTASLDPKHQHLLMKRIYQLSRQEKFGVMVIIHDLNLAARWCDQLLLMKDGISIANARPTLAFTPETLQKCFDISMHVVPHPKNLSEIIVLVGD